MDKLDFDLIYRETLAEVEPALIRKLQLFIKDVLSKDYPEVILKEQIIELIQDYSIYSLRAVLTESVRATSLMLEKYHEKV